MSGNGFFITGTDTGVGKTLVCTALVKLFRSYGKDVGVMKPVMTGVKSNLEKTSANDAYILKRTSDTDDSLDLINPYCFKEPISPHLAARLNNQEIDEKLIKDNFNKIKIRHEIVIMEGIGGISVPFSDNFFIGDLIRELNLPAIIVARASLGTINHTLLSIHYAKRIGIEIAGVIINNMPENPSLAERANPGEIERLTNVPVLGVIPEIKIGDVSINLTNKNHLKSLTVILREFNRSMAERLKYLKKGSK